MRAATMPGSRLAKLAVVAIIPELLAGSAGSFATIPNIPVWYAGLAKPWFNPPNQVFGPAWTLLYLMMAIAFFRILRAAPSQPGRAAAIAVFLVQIALNAAWSWVFFAGHSPAGGLAVIVALWAMIAITIAAFARLDAIAAWCLAPYLAWVGFAGLLNLAIYRMN